MFRFPGPSPLDSTYLARLAREMCRSRSEDSMHFPDPFNDYGSSGAASPVLQVQNTHSPPTTMILDVHDDDDENHESHAHHDEPAQDSDQRHDAFGHLGNDFGRTRQDRDSLETVDLTYSDHEVGMDGHIVPNELLAMESSPWEDQVSGNDRSSPSLERTRERVDSPQRSRRNPLSAIRREEMNYHSDNDGERSQSNTDSRSRGTSRHSRSSSRSFSHSLDNETRMTTPISPKDESPLLENLSLQNPRGPRFHCRLCMVEPCEEATATFCGHIFCNS